MTVSGRTRILVADDQDDVLSGFRLVLNAQPDMRVVGEARNGANALDLARRLQPDVVIADIRMPSMDGLELTRRLTEPDGTSPIKVIVVTTFDLDEYVSEALQLGASGFLLKRSGPTLLIEAVRAAMAGDALISPQVTVRLLRRLAATTRIHSTTPGMPALTEREIEVAREVAAGHTNVEIGARLFIADGTVKTHLANIQAKLGVKNRVGIAAWAWANGHAPI